MARRKDIDRASALLEGTQGWHIEYHGEADYKTSKRRSHQKCFYFNHDICNHAHTPCMGVNCGAYSEKYFK